MYCSVCGQANGPNARVCSHCGHPISLAEAVAPSPVPLLSHRVEKHLQTVGILWIVYAFMGVLGWLFAIPFLTAIFGHGFMGHHAMEFPFIGLSALLPFVTALVFTRAGLQALAGVALVMRVRWGRVLAIVVAFLTILKVPFGTGLSIYTLWVLLPGDAGRAYEEMAAH